LIHVADFPPEDYTAAELKVGLMDFDAGLPQTARGARLK
jgi:hypothetical protein